MKESRVINTANINPDSSNSQKGCQGQSPILVKILY